MENNLLQIQCRDTTLTEGSINSAPSADLSLFVLDPSSGVPNEPPELEVTEESAQCELSPNKIFFLGIWCLPMIVENKPSVTLKHILIEMSCKKIRFW